MTLEAFWFFSFFMLFSATMVVASRDPVHGVLYLIVAFFNAAALFLVLNAELLAMLLVIVYVGAVAVLFLFVVMMIPVDTAEKTPSLRSRLERILFLMREIFFYAIPFALLFTGVAYGFYALGWMKTDMALPYQVAFFVTLFILCRFGVHRITQINLFDTLKAFATITPLAIFLIFLVGAEIAWLVYFNRGDTVIYQGASAMTSRDLGRLLFTTHLLSFFLCGFILLVAMVGAMILTLRKSGATKRQNLGAQTLRSPKNSLDMVTQDLGKGIDMLRKKP